MTGDQSKTGYKFTTLTLSLGGLIFPTVDMTVVSYQLAMPQAVHRHCHVLLQTLVEGESFFISHIDPIPIHLL